MDGHGRRVVLDRFVIAGTMALSKQVVSGLNAAERIQRAPGCWIGRYVLLPVDRDMGLFWRGHTTSYAYWYDNSSTLISIINVLGSFSIIVNLRATCST